MNEIKSDFICHSKFEYCTINAIFKFKASDTYKTIKLKYEGDIMGLSDKIVKYIILKDNEYTILYNYENRKFTKLINLQIYEYKIQHGYYLYNLKNDPTHHNRSGAYLMATDNDEPNLF
jgi:hypothetical protein